MCHGGTYYSEELANFVMLRYVTSRAAAVILFSRVADTEFVARFCSVVENRDMSSATRWLHCSYTVSKTRCTYSSVVLADCYPFSDTISVMSAVICQLWLRVNI